eukprot:scaffold32335_cov119-Isochrysis_galbana.AAC.3
MPSVGALAPAAHAAHTPCTHTGRPTQRITCWRLAQDGARWPYENRATRFSSCPPTERARRLMRASCRRSTAAPVGPWRSTQTWTRG